MQSVLTRATLLPAALLVAVTGTARAEVVEVEVPFPFAVDGQPFSPGEYRLERDPTDSSVMLIRGEKGNTARMFVLTTSAEGPDPAGDRPAVTFKRDQNQYRLADIWESNGQGRAVTAGFAGTQTARHTPAAAQHASATHAMKGPARAIDHKTPVITRTTPSKW